MGAAREQKLHIRHVGLRHRLRPNDADAAGNVAGDAGAAQEVGVGESCGDAVEPHRLVERAGELRAIGQHRGDMVLQVLPDAAQRAPAA